MTASECQACGAPHAADQHWCLECGARLRPSALLAPVTLPAPEPAPALAAPAVVVVPSMDPRLSGALAFLLLSLAVMVGAATGSRTSDSLAAPDGSVAVILPAPQPAAAPVAVTPPPPIPATPAPEPVAEEPDPVVEEPAPVSEEPVAEEEDEEPAEEEETGPKLPAIGHVTVVALSDITYDLAYGPETVMPYLGRELANQGQILPRYRATTKGSLANGLALLGGIDKPTPEQQADCPTYLDKACVLPVDEKSLLDQLTSSGLTWKVYAENQELDPATPSCRHPALDQPDPWTGPRPGDSYVTFRNPAVYFHSIIDSPDCSANVVGLDQLDRDLAAEDQLPAFSLVVPSLCNSGRVVPCEEGRVTGPAAADEWLRAWMPKLLATKAHAKDGLIVVISDTGERTGAVMLSPFVEPGNEIPKVYDHVALLRSIEDIFGLERLGAAAERGVEGFGPKVFGRTP